MNIKIFLKPLTLLCILALPVAAAAQAPLVSSGNISATDKYAWSETVGWSNLAAVSAGVSVYDDHLEGFAWNENIGWIKLGSHSGGGYFTYANSTSSDWGVNLNGAALSGYGWSEAAGWVNFSPTGGGVSINPATGGFDGWAWGENLGWIHFKGVSPAYTVTFVPDQWVGALSVDSGSPMSVRAAVNGSGIHLSSNGGANWSAATTQPTDLRLKAIVAHPATATTLFAATHGSGVFTSINGGTDWSACANSRLNANVYSLVIDSGMLYAGTKGGIFSSPDCATWTAKNSGLPVSGGVYRQSELVVDPVTSTTLYAGISGSGIYKTIDSGATWTAATTQPDNTQITAVTLKNSATLYVATSGSGVYKSGDSGTTWEVCTNSGLTNLNVVSLAIDASGKLYAGTEDGVFASADGCGLWTAMNGGLPN